MSRHGSGSMGISMEVVESIGKGSVRKGCIE